MPESADRRVRIARALADHAQAGRGLDADHYPPERWLCCADAALAALDNTVLRPFTLDFSEADPGLVEEFAAKIREWDLAGRPLELLPPNAVMIYRRTPEQRRTYLLDHRDEAIANGIPEDLVDMLIADTEAGEPA